MSAAVSLQPFFFFPRRLSLLPISFKTRRPCTQGNKADRTASFSLSLFFLSLTRLGSLAKGARRLLLLERKPLFSAASVEARVRAIKAAKGGSRVQQLIGVLTDACGERVTRVSSWTDAGVGADGVEALRLLATRVRQQLALVVICHVMSRERERGKEEDGSQRGISAERVHQEGSASAAQEACNRVYLAFDHKMSNDFASDRSPIEMLAVPAVTRAASFPSLSR